MMRAAALEREVQQLTTSRDADAREVQRLQQSLAAAQSEIVRLGGSAPVAHRNTRPAKIALLVGVTLAVATAVAGAQSERFGVSMSYLAVMPFGFALGAMVAARRGTAVQVGSGVAGAVAFLVLLAVFYTAIWPSL